MTPLDRSYAPPRAQGNHRATAKRHQDDENGSPSETGKRRVFRRFDILVAFTNDKAISVHLA